MLQSIHKSLDQVPLTITLLEKPAFFVAAFPARYDGRTPALPDGGDNFIAVVCLVSDDILWLVICQQRGGLLAVVDLARGDDQFNRTTFRVDCQVDLRAEASARTAQCFVTPPFPAACWWARIMVESSIKHSRSGSCHVLRSSSQIPRLHQRLNRWNTEFHAPKRSGRSRHGAPVFAIQSTAFTNNRLSAAVRPGSLNLPGNRASIFSHCSSEISCRRILDSSLNQRHAFNNRKPRSTAI